MIAFEVLRQLGYESISKFQVRAIHELPLPEISPVVSERESSLNSVTLHLILIQICGDRGLNGIFSSSLKLADIHPIE
jgi:hypothetical protein